MRLRWLRDARADVHRIGRHVAHDNVDAAERLLTGKYAPEATFPAGDVRADDPLFQEERFHRNLELVERLRGIAQNYGVTVAQMALNRTLRRPAVTVDIAGAKRPAQVEENVGGQGRQFSADEPRRIQTWLDDLA